MDFRRGKLLPEPHPIPAFEHPCTKFCDPNRNYDGLCPLFCLPLCFSTCKQTLLLPPRPPFLPPPPTPDFPASSSSAVHTVSHFRAPVVLSVLAVAAVFLSITFFLVYTIVRSTAGGGSRTPPSEEEEEQEEDGGVERLSDAVVEHPIWYIRTAGLGSSIINRITVCRYERGEGSRECCSVCLSEFEEGEMVRVLPKCHHTFHVHCIDTWLRSHTNCPICRSAIAVVHHHQQEVVHHDDHQEENNSSDIYNSRREEEMMVLDHEDMERDRGGGVGNYEVIHMNDQGGSGRIMIRRSVSMEFCVCPKRSCSSSSSSSMVMNESGTMRSLSCNDAIFSSLIQ